MQEDVDMLCVAQSRDPGPVRFSQPVPFKDLFEQVQNTLTVKKIFAFTNDGSGGFHLREVGSLQLSFVALSEQTQPPAPLPPISPPAPAIQAPIYSADQEPEEEDEEEPALNRYPTFPVVVKPTRKANRKKQSRVPAKTSAISIPSRASNLTAGAISVDGFVPAQDGQADQHDLTTGWND